MSNGDSTMSVCRKRSYSVASPTSASPPQSKKLHCSLPASRSSPPQPALTDELRAPFQGFDKQFIEKALEESGHDLDLAIKRMNELILDMQKEI